MRVVHIGKYYPPVLGGIETHLESLALGLHEHVDLRVLVANTKRTTVTETPGGVNLVRLGRVAQIASAPLVRGLSEHLQEAKPDIVHLHHPNPFATITWLRNPVGKLVISYHGDTVRQRFLGRAFSPVLRAALGRSSAVIAATRNHVELSPVLSPFAERCHIVPYGIDLEHFAVADREEVGTIRARFGERLILALGRLVYYKGFDVLVRAMGDVDGHLVLIGEGPLQQDLRRQIAELGLASKVTMLGAVSDIRPWYHAAAMFVLPSVARSEAFGIVQLEAMAARTPVINTGLPSGAPLVSLDGLTGMTVEPGNSGALAKAMGDLLASRDLRARMGAAGYERVREGFTIEQMVSGTLAVYRRVLGRASGDRPGI